MNYRAGATRYARALFDVSLAEGDPRAVERQLAAFVELVAGHPLLRKVLESPTVPLPRRQAAISALGERIGLEPAPGKLLALLAGRDAFAMLPELLDRYRHRLREHLGEVEAEVTTAVPLGERAVDALRARLAAATGKQVTVVTRVDPALVGGVVTRIGSTVYDGSVTRQLERLRDRIVEGAAV